MGVLRVYKKERLEKVWKKRVAKWLSEGMNLERNWNAEVIKQDD